MRNSKVVVVIVVVARKQFRLAVGKSALEAKTAISSDEVSAYLWLEVDLAVVVVKQLSFTVGKAALTSTGACSSIMREAPPGLEIAVVVVIVIIDVVVVVSDSARPIEACRIIRAEGVRLTEACAHLPSAASVERRLSCLLLLLRVSRCCCCHPKAGPPISKPGSLRGLGLTRDNSNERNIRLRRREGDRCMTVGLRPEHVLRNVHSSYSLAAHLRS
jgi:hypothetical protein